jgi:hypothetical protein
MRKNILYTAAALTLGAAGLYLAFNRDVPKTVATPKPQNLESVVRQFTQAAAHVVSAPATQPPMTKKPQATSDATAFNEYEMNFIDRTNPSGIPVKVSMPANLSVKLKEIPENLYWHSRVETDVSEKERDESRERGYDVPPTATNNYSPYNISYFQDTLENSLVHTLIGTRSPQGAGTATVYLGTVGDDYKDNFSFKMSCTVSGTLYHLDGTRDSAEANVVGSNVKVSCGPLQPAAGSVSVTGQSAPNP